MKLLIVTNGYPPTAFGGVEVYSQSIAAGLVERGHAVTVFCRDSDPAAPDYELRDEEQDGVRVLRVVNDFKAIRSFHQTYRNEHIGGLFEQLLADVDPDLIQFNHVIALSADLPLIAAVQKIPSLISLHDYWYICHRVRLQDWRDERCGGPLQGGDCYRCVVGAARWFKLRRQGLLLAKNLMPPGLRRKIREWGWIPPQSSVTAASANRGDFEARRKLFAKSLRSSQQVLTPSEYLKKVYQANGFADLTIEVLPLGMQIPERRRKRISADDVIKIGFAGTLMPDKGPHVLIEAFRRVSSDRLNLEIYGRADADTGYMTRLRRLAGDDERIHLRGPFSVDQRDEIYRSLDLLVLPSLFQETYSLVAREALLLGTPLFASDVGALPEIIKPGVNGELFPPGDVEALARLIQRVSGNPDQLSSYKLPGPVPILSVEEHLDRLEEIYTGLL
jgi:glycosyltransferase involved in cell wall biosynthesis